MQERGDWLSVRRAHALNASQVEANWATRSGTCEPLREWGEGQTALALPYSTAVGRMSDHRGRRLAGSI